MPRTRDVIRDIRREWTEETGEDPGNGGASVILDNLCEAFFHAWQGGGPGYAVAKDPATARYLANRWTGDDRKRLRMELVAYDRQRAASA